MTEKPKNTIAQHVISVTKKRVSHLRQKHNRDAQQTNPETEPWHRSTEQNRTEE